SGEGAEGVNCIQLVELVTVYLEGSMSAEQRARFEEHIAGCDGCTTYLEQFRITIKLTGMLSDEQIAPEARETLLGVFRDWRTSAQPRCARHATAAHTVSSAISTV